MTAETVVGTDSAVLAARDAEKEADSRRKLAILKAVGLDRAAPEQRELAIAIAKRYDLDLMLKHLVLIDGKPYVTRDALLWIAHRDGHLDGIEVTRPVVEDDFWYCEATVYRTDMSHPFKYGGRYPVKGQNQKFAPEMATKVAESMALRRAFNISAPTQDERWDVDVSASEPEQPKSLAEKVAEKAQAVQEPTEDITEAAEAIFTEDPIQDPAPSAEPTGGSDTSGSPTSPQPASDNAATSAASTPAGMVQCESKSPFGTADAPIQCRREMGHRGAHKTESESWPA